MTEVTGFTVPGRFDWTSGEDQTITVVCWGGGSDSGARSFIDVLNGEQLTVRVGAHGAHGGYNGGGSGAAPVHLTDSIQLTARGSGASDVRQGGDRPVNRVCVGGGRSGYSWHRIDGVVVPGLGDGVAPPFIGGEGTDTMLGPNLPPNTTDGGAGWDATYTDRRLPAEVVTRELHVAGGGGGYNDPGVGPSGESGWVWESQTDPSYHHPPDAPYVGHDDWLWHSEVIPGYSGRSLSLTADYGMGRPAPWEFDEAGDFAFVDGLVVIYGTPDDSGWKVGQMGWGSAAWR